MHFVFFSISFFFFFSEKKREREKKKINLLTYPCMHACIAMSIITDDFPFFIASES